ncbi:MAG TPA: phasin family protein [Candidatus Aquicultor sp.]
MANIGDLIRQSFYLGIGAVALTADKLQEWANELVERGEMSRDQASAMVSELTKRGQEARMDMRNMIKDEVKKAIDELELPTRHDIQRLDDKLDRLILIERQENVAATATNVGPGEASPEVR